MKAARIISLLICFALVLTVTETQTWSALKRLTWNSGDSSNPFLVIASPTNFYLVWHDDPTGNMEIYFKKSTNGGTSWGAPVRMTWNSGYSNTPRLCLSPNSNLHVVWFDDTSGADEVYYKRSINGGTSWSSPERLTWNTNNSRRPWIVSNSNNNLFIFWYDSVGFNSDIYYKKSTNNGTSWGTLSRFTWTATQNTHPVAAINSSDHIHVAWFDGGTVKEIYHKSSTDGGSSWSATHRLTWNTGKTYSPALAIDSNDDLHIVYDDDTAGNPEVYYKKSTNNGNTWTAPSRLTWTSKISRMQTIIADINDDLHLVWGESTLSGYDLYYKNSINSGTTWSTPERLTWNDGWSINPFLAGDSAGAVHLVWADDFGYMGEIYYRKRD